MAPKAARQAAQKKAAKQKKVLIVLAPLLVLALVYAFMTLSHGKSSAPSPANPAAATTPAGSIPIAAPAAVPVTPGVAAPPAGSLVAFTSLSRRDPFRHGGGKLTSGPSIRTQKPPITHSTSKPKKAPGLTRAVISVNGKRFTVGRGATFGHAPGSSGSSPFRLLGGSATRVVIAVVGTQLRYLLNLRLPSILVTQARGPKYTLILESARLAPTTAGRH